MVPAIIAGGLTFSAMRTMRRDRTATAASARGLLRGASRERILGYDVWQVADARPFAVAYPGHTGIVISNGTRAVLTSGELAAVLAHEGAHVRQHHHLVWMILRALAGPLRWLPLVRAAVDAVLHYLEIAADDVACRQVGTTALASALLKLGTGGADATLTDSTAAVLHAAGPSRIRHLVSPAGSGASPGTTGICLLLLATVVAVSAIVHLPYLQAVLSGCV